VRWGSLKRLKHYLQNSIEVVDDLIVPEPDNAIAAAGQFDRALSVGLGVCRVLSAVQLDHQFPRRAGEVDYAAADRVLTAEFPGRPHGPQCLPQPLLDIGGIASQPARHHGPLSHCHRRPHLTPTLSAPGGGEGA
jgi:hypothetical protein